jgi:hypothetical protein
MNNSLKLSYFAFYYKLRQKYITLCLALIKQLIIK